MNLLWVIVILLLVFAILGAPGIGPWQHGYGYWPSSIGFILLVVLVVLLLTGRL